MVPSDHGELRVQSETRDATAGKDRASCQRANSGSRGRDGVESSLLQEVGGIAAVGHGPFQWDDQVGEQAG